MGKAEGMDEEMQLQRIHVRMGIRRGWHRWRLDGEKEEVDGAGLNAFSLWIDVGHVWKGCSRTDREMFL